MLNLVAHSRTYRMDVTQDVADAFTVFGPFGSGGDFATWMKESDGVIGASLLRDRILVTIEPESDGPDLREEIAERLEMFLEADRAAFSGKGRDALPPIVRVEVERAGIDHQGLLDRLVRFATENCYHEAGWRKDGWRWHLYVQFEGLSQFPQSVPLDPQLSASLREEMEAAGWGPVDAISSVMDLIRTKSINLHHEIEDRIRAAIEAESVATPAP